MAETLGTIKGQMILDVKQALAAYTSARQAHIATTVALSTGAAAMTAAGATVAAAGVAMAGGVLAAVNASAKFEKTMDYAAAISNVTGKEFDTLKQKAIQLGQDTIYSAQQIGDSFVELAKAGVPAQDVINGVGDAVAHLGAAADIPLDTAANIITAAVQTFSLSADQAVGVADKLAGAANSSIVDVQDLGTSLKYVGGTAHALGGSFDEVNTALAILGTAGIKGSTAGTSLRQILVSLSGATPKATAALKELGIITEDGANKFFDAQGKMKPLAEVFQILQDAEKGLTSEQQVMIDKAIFQQRAISSVATLTKAGAAGFDQMAASINKITAADIASKRLNNLSGDIEILRGNMDTLLITAGGGFQNFARFVVQSITKVVGAFNSLSPAVQTTILGITGGVGAFLILVGTFGIMAGQVLNLINLFLRLNDILKITAAVQGVWNAVTGVSAALWGALNRVMAANPILFVVSLILLLITTIYTLMGGWKEIAKIFKPVGDQLVKVFKDIMKALEPVGKAFAQVAGIIGGIFAGVLKQIVTALIPPLLALFKAIAPILSAIAQIVGAVLVPVLGLLTPIFQLIALVLKVVMAVLSPFISLLTGILVPILNAVAWVLQLVADAIQWFADQISKFFGSAIPTVLQVFGKAWDKLYNNYLAPFFSKLMAAVKPVVDWFQNTFQPIMTNVADALGKAWTANLKVIQAEWKALQNFLKPIVDWYVNTFVAPMKNAGKGLEDGMKNYAIGSAAAWQGFLKAMQPVGDFFNAWVVRPIQIGVGIVKALIESFVRKFEEIKGRIDKALEPVRQAWERFQTTWQQKLDQIKATIEPFITKFENLRDRVSDAIQKMKDKIQPILDKFHTMWDTLVKKLDPLIKKLEEIFNKIGAALDKIFGSGEQGGQGGGGGAKGKGKSKADLVLDILTNLATFLLSGAGNVLIAILTLLSWIITGLANAFDFAGKVMEAAWKVIGPILDAFGKALSWLWNNVINPVLTGIVIIFEWAFNTIIAIVGPVVKWVIQQISFWETLLGIVKPIFDGVVKFMKDPFGTIGDFFNKIIDKVKQPFANASNWLIEAGKNVIRGLINGLDAMTGGLVSKLGHITGLIPKNKGPKSVDLRLLEPAGMWIMQGLINGIDSQVSNLTATLGSIGESVPDSLTSSLSMSKDMRDLYDSMSASRQLNTTMTAELIRSTSDDPLKTIGDALETIAEKDTVHIDQLDVNNPEPEPASTSVPKAIRKAAYIPG